MTCCSAHVRSRWRPNIKILDPHTAQAAGTPAKDTANLNGPRVRRSERHTVQINVLDSGLHHLSSKTPTACLATLDQSVMRLDVLDVCQRDIAKQASTRPRLPSDVKVGAAHIADSSLHLGNE